MNAVRGVLLGLALVLLFGMSDAAGQNARKKGSLKVPDLVPQETLEKLNLTARQSKQAAQLQEEFANAAKQSRMQMMPAMKRAKANMDQATMKKLRATMILNLDQTRKVMEPRFVRLLTPQQKKMYAELKKDAPAVGRAAKTGAKKPETVKGTIKRLDPDTGNLSVTIDGQTKTYQVSRATKVLDADGKELANGLSDKALAPGTEVSVTFSTQGRLQQRASVTELRLMSK